MLGAIIFFSIIGAILVVIAITISTEKLATFISIALLSLLMLGMGCMIKDCCLTKALIKDGKVQYTVNPETGKTKKILTDSTLINVWKTQNRR